MKYASLLAISLLIGSSELRGQSPGVPNDLSRDRLDSLLGRWEQQMRSVQGIVAQCTRTSVDKTFQQTEIFDGTAKYMKPNLAMLEMQKRGQPQTFEKYICTGTYLYEYAPANREIRIHELPAPRPGQVADDNFLSFLFGMRADEAKRRYDLKLAKVDEWWTYIEITPRFPADRADFQTARLVLSAQTFLPRELRFQQPNGNEVMWDIPRIDTSTPINRDEFTQPAVPPGWRMVRVPRPTEPTQDNFPPRVVRPNR